MKATIFAVAHAANAPVRAGQIVTILLRRRGQERVRWKDRAHAYDGIYRAIASGALVHIAPDADAKRVRGWIWPRDVGPLPCVPWAPRTTVDKNALLDWLALLDTGESTVWMTVQAIAVSLAWTDTWAFERVRRILLAAERAKVPGVRRRKERGGVRWLWAIPTRVSDEPSCAVSPATTRDWAMSVLESCARRQHRSSVTWEALKGATSADSYRRLRLALSALSMPQRASVRSPTVERVVVLRGVGAESYYAPSTWRGRAERELEFDAAVRAARWLRERRQYDASPESLQTAARVRGCAGGWLADMIARRGSGRTFQPAVTTTPSLHWWTMDEMRSAGFVEEVGMRSRRTLLGAMADEHVWMWSPRLVALLPPNASRSCEGERHDCIESVDGLLWLASRHADPRVRVTARLVRAVVGLARGPLTIIDQPGCASMYPNWKVLAAIAEFARGGAFAEMIALMQRNHAMVVQPSTRGGRGRKV